MLQARTRVSDTEASRQCHIGTGPVPDLRHRYRHRYRTAGGWGGGGGGPPLGGLSERQLPDGLAVGRKSCMRKG
jgi:hypothetical protein